MVKFVNGRAVAVKGKPHKGVDTAKSSSVLEKAYKRRAVSGANKPVTLPVTLQQPKIGDAELKTAVNGFGRTAMSGWVYAEGGRREGSVQPEDHGQVPDDARGRRPLQPVIDPVALKKTYGTAFDGVVVDGGAGKVRMTPQHAASAMIQALRKKAPPKPGNASPRSPEPTRADPRAPAGTAQPGAPPPRMAGAPSCCPGRPDRDLSRGRAPSAPGARVGVMRAA